MFVDIIENGVAQTFIVYEGTDLRAIHERWLQRANAARTAGAPQTFGQYLSFHGYADPVTASTTFEVTAPHPLD